MTLKFGNDAERLEFWREHCRKKGISEENAPLLMKMADSVDRDIFASFEKKKKDV